MTSPHSPVVFLYRPMTVLYRLVTDQSGLTTTSIRETTFCAVSVTKFETVGTVALVGTNRRKKYFTRPPGIRIGQKMAGGQSPRTAQSRIKEFFDKFTTHHFLPRPLPGFDSASRFTQTTCRTVGIPCAWTGIRMLHGGESARRTSNNAGIQKKEK
jgi:hypothetical protein